MSQDLRRSADAILERVVNDAAPVAGVAAIATDRNGSIYDGAAGVRTLGSEAPFTTDTVCAIFSTTKAIAGTVALIADAGGVTRSRRSRQAVRARDRGIAGARRLRG